MLENLKEKFLNGTGLVSLNNPKSERTKKKKIEFYLFKRSCFLYEIFSRKSEINFRGRGEVKYLHSM